MNLRGANLEGANLKNAKLDKTDLRDANLKNVQGADFKDAWLTTADMSKNPRTLPSSRHDYDYSSREDARAGWEMIASDCGFDIDNIGEGDMDGLEDWLGH